MDGCTGDGNNVFLKMTGGVKSRKRKSVKIFPGILDMLLSTKECN